MKRKVTRRRKPFRAKSGAKSKARHKTAAPGEVIPHDTLGELVAANAQALALPLDPVWHAAIKFNLQLILRHAALVEGFPLPDDAEPAPIFHA
jgi:hypothetical protein